MVFGISLDQVTAIFGGLACALTAISVVLQFIQTKQKKNPHDVMRIAEPNATTEVPNIRSTGGVPTLEQLTQDIEIYPENGRRIRRLYEMGLVQFNHEINNRDGILAESRKAMGELKTQLCSSQIERAEKVGIAMSATSEDERQQGRAQYDNLDPLSQIYAQHKNYEWVTLKAIARDIDKKVPRTDYTSVKSRIKSGRTSLDTIMGELPIQWQDIRTINEWVSTKPPAIKPKPREFMRVVFTRSDGSRQIDRRVEIHGDWIESQKYGYMAPRECIYPIWPFRSPTTFMSKPEYGLSIDQPLSSDYVTEFWRQGGFRDSRYCQYRDGRSPDQLHRAYRKRQALRILWTVNVAVWAIALIMIVIRFL